MKTSVWNEGKRTLKTQIHELLKFMIYLNLKIAWEEKLYTLIETGVSGDVFQPEIIRQKLIDQIAGLSNFFWIKFTTTTGSVLDVEIIELPKNAIAQIDTDTLDLRT